MLVSRRRRRRGRVARVLDLMDAFLEAAQCYPGTKTVDHPPQFLSAPVLRFFREDLWPLSVCVKETLCLGSGAIKSTF